ncbi:MAG TPA: alpha/beta fold hydrolase [Acidimicrobiales bacterium]|nr:alpha/beta fold hydrolase [Acidimicrobiales bacterium]
MTHLALKDELLDAQLLRTVGSAPYGGADVGECLSTVARIKGTDLASWHNEWVSTAAATQSLAERALEAGRTETARLAFLRAASYFRTAGVMLMAPPADERLVRAYAAQTEAFRRAAALFAQPPEIVDIPFDGSPLPGYHFRPDGDPGRRATVLLVGGYDGTAEELYLLNGAAALARGYNVLAFDGPGQGAALLRLGLTMRADFERVVTAAVDYLCTRRDTDPARLAVIGLSLGGYLAPRAASVEHRLAACIADCGSYDLFAAARQRIPGPLAAAVDGGSGARSAVLRRILKTLAAKPTAGWALRRGQLVHGVDDPLDYLRALRDFSLQGRAGSIRCPTLVCLAEGDDISESAPRLYAELTCDKELVHFTAAEGAGDHCEAGARTLYHARTFAWLDGILHPET